MAMTHDELRERLSIEQGCPVGDALRAVVELHKPNANDYQGIVCSHCTMYEYQCPTIQAIEKELNSGD